MKLRLACARTALLALAVGLAGCSGIPVDALKLGSESMAQRKLQTRLYEGLNEADALSAGASVLQDLGFTITESEVGLGVVVGSKNRSAGLGSTFGKAAALTFGGPGSLWSFDTNQKFIASLITRPVFDQAGNAIPGSFYCRVTFARIVWNQKNEIKTAEQLNDPALYQGFFERMSRSVFLEGQKI